MFSIVKNAIDKYDPYGLLAIGAPNDEYDIESQKIALRINESNSTSEIAEIVAEVFTCAFDKNFSKESFIEVANEIKTAFSSNYSK